MKKRFSLLVGSLISAAGLISAVPVAADSPTSTVVVTQPVTTSVVTVTQNQVTNTVMATVVQNQTSSGASYIGWFWLGNSGILHQSNSV